MLCGCGCGIDPADQPHIFERFYRGRNGRTEGSGLGLAIVQSVVQAHGGQVSVKSNPVAGSLFVIELPERGNE
jgi:signal transduction histidine kinase